MEVLRVNKDETAPEWLDSLPRLRGHVLALKSFTELEKPAVESWRASESMADFYLLGDASGQGFGSGLWDYEELRYYSANWSTQWKIEISNWKETTNITVRVEELSKKLKL